MLIKSLFNNLWIFVVIFFGSLLIFFSNKSPDIEFQNPQLVQVKRKSLQEHTMQDENQVMNISKMSIHLEEFRLVKFKEKLEKSRLKIERFRKIQNEIFERQKRVRFIKNLVFQQYRNIDKNIFSIQNPQKKYLYQQKKREAQKQMLEKIQGEYYEK